MEGPSAQSEAASAPAPTSASDKAADFENFLFGEDEEQDNEPTEAEEQEGAEEGDDLDFDDEGEEGEQDDEPETAIEPPASLNAEEKAKFGQLPSEAQALIRDVETRRNQQVQEATTKASEAQRTAEARAAVADAEAAKVYAVQLDQFVAAYEPQMPDPQLAQYDPAAYIAQKAQYDAQKAQHDQLVQQVRGVYQEASQAERQAFIQSRDRELMQIPEIANPESRENYLNKAFEVAKSLGYDQAELAEGMTARDIKALAMIAELQEVKAKFDKAMARKMQRVRAGKTRVNRPQASPHADARATQGKQAWQRVKTARSKDAQAEAFADYLGL